MILSTHLLPDIERTCDAVVVLNKGRVLAAGSLNDLRRDECRRYEVRIKGDCAAFTGALTAAGFAWTIDDEQLITVVGGDYSAQRLFALARSACAQIRHLRAPSATLEDVFVTLVDGRSDRATGSWTADDGDV